MMRPIIVRLHSYNDRKAVWSARSALKYESISINENFAAEVEYIILIYAILKSAIHSIRFERKTFTYCDTIVQCNQSYSIEDLHKLPHDLHPSNLSKKENDQWLISGDILSQHNYLYKLTRVNSFIMTLNLIPQKQHISILRQRECMIRHV